MRLRSPLPAQHNLTAVGPDGIDLISKLLVCNPAARLSAKQVCPTCVFFHLIAQALKHEYFSNAPGPTPPTGLVAAGFLQVQRLIIADPILTRTPVVIIRRPDHSYMSGHLNRVVLNQHRRSQSGLASESPSTKTSLPQSDLCFNVFLSAIILSSIEFYFSAAMR